MKKQLISAVLVVLLAVQLLGCAGEGEVEPDTPDTTETDSVTESETEAPAEDTDPTLVNFREVLGEDDFCAAAYLGYLDGSYYEIMSHIEELGVLEAFPFLEIPKDNYVPEDGGELYAVVPSDKNATVRVYTAVIDETDYTVKPDIGIAEFEGGVPILIKCNVSEIVPNVVVEIISGENKHTFSPFLSGENGQLAPIDGVYDFSPYDVLFAGISDGAAYVFCDEWYTLQPNRRGDDYVLRLEMLPDGTAYYGYGPMASEYEGNYVGIWEYDMQNGTVSLKLDEVPIVYEGMELASGYEPGKLESVFTWEMTDEGLTLTHTDGDEIFEGSSGGAFAFQLKYDFYGITEE